MKLFLFLLLGLVYGARAETVRDLSQNNASPEEIIQKLNEPDTPKNTVPKSKKPIQVGTLVSLIHKGDDTPFYEFTISLTDGQVVTVTDANHWGLRPGDGVILMGNEDFWRIKDTLPK